MQTLRPTWNAILARHRIPPGGAQPPSRYDPHDAIHAAAYYLCDNGAGRGNLRGSLRLQPLPAVRGQRPGPGPPLLSDGLEYFGGVRFCSVGRSVRQRRFQ